MRTKSYKARIEAIIESARTEVGYRSRAQKDNQYGAKIGQNGQAWAGLFLESVFRANGERNLPAMTSTVSALAEFSRNGQLRSKPLPGDIVFYGFSTDHAFAQPHVGLVTETDRFDTDGFFRAIEGQVDSGLPKGPQEADGVYERTRRSVDVLAFARPKYRDVNYSPQTDSEAPFVRPALFQPGKTGKSIVLLQTALHATVGARGMERGKFDKTTQAGVAAFQRHIGLVGSAANGIPNEITLRRLALETNHKFFRYPSED